MESFPGYKLIRKIGEVGMAVVYEGVQTSLDTGQVPIEVDDLIRMIEERI